MHRPMLPRPATSTTFSCQLSSTLMAAPVDSAVEPGLPPIWLNPVGCGVRFLGVRGAVDALPVPVLPPAMPLYLLKRVRKNRGEIIRGRDGGGLCSQA